MSIKTIENVEGKAKSASAKLVQFTAFSANYVNDKWVKTGTNIEAKMDDVGSVTKSAEEALNKLNTAGKGTNEALKKMKEKAEEALGAIMDKGKDTKKAIEEIQEKIKNSTDDWKKYKQEGVDALREISLEMKKLRDEAEKINLDFGINKEQKLGERMVEVLNEINDIQKDIAGEEDAGRRAEMEQKLNALLAERTFIQSNASQNAIDEAMAYASLSEAQKIVVDLEKEKGKALDENKAKMDALVEKRMVLEAQANQASMDQQKIFTEIKD